MDNKKYILFGVLNWGLGHASRSVPLIRALIRRGYTPVLTSDGVALSYLQKEFPDLPFEELKPYRITYKHKSFFWQMLLQLPTIAGAIVSEYWQLKKLIRIYKPVGIISDNRLGFFSKETPSVYLTHQLRILAPFPWCMATYIHRFFISSYTECWVPDNKEAPGLSGSMGHISVDNLPVKYIGPLSRFANISPGNKAKVYDAVAILSGPEPQRTLLEKKILNQLKDLPGEFALVRGVEGEVEGPDGIRVFDLIKGERIAELINSARIIISRSGYSSLMDYYFLGNKALLIPTPGQVEQEYLAKLLSKEGVFHTVSQTELNLKEDLSKAEGYNGFSILDKPIALDDGLFSLFEGK